MQDVRHLSPRRIPNTSALALEPRSKARSRHRCGACDTRRRQVAHAEAVDFCCWTPAKMAADLEVRVGAQVEDDQQLAVAVGVHVAVVAALRPLEIAHHLLGSVTTRSQTGDSRQDTWLGLPLHCIAHHSVACWTQGRPPFPGDAGGPVLQAARCSTGGVVCDQGCLTASGESVRPKPV